MIAVLAISASTPALCQADRLTVNITGLRSDKGKLYLSLYNSAKGYPKDATVAYRLAFTEIHNGKATVTLTGLPSGTYAIACYHDENDNGKLDTNFMGIPKEGTGASNNAKSSMGPPKFRDAKFQLAGDTTLTIRMNY